MLGITLLEITHPADKLFTGNFFVVGQEVALGGLPGVVDQDVGVCSHTRNSTDHITIIVLAPVPSPVSQLLRKYRLLVQNIKLLRRRILLQQFAGHLLLGSENDTIVGEDS